MNRQERDEFEMAMVELELEMAMGRERLRGIPEADAINSATPEEEAVNTQLGAGRIEAALDQFESDVRDHERGTDPEVTEADVDASRAGLRSVWGIPESDVREMVAKVYAECRWGVPWEKLASLRGADEAYSVADTTIAAYRKEHDRT